MIKSATDRQSARAFRMAGWLALAAMPVFAAMAWVAATGPGPMALCSASPVGLPIHGMPAMYLLMSVFHLPPWLRLHASVARS